MAQIPAQIIAQIFAMQEKVLISPHIFSQKNLQQFALQRKAQIFAKSFVFINLR